MLGNNFQNIIEQLNQIINFKFFTITNNDEFFNDAVNLEYINNYTVSFNHEYHEERNYIYEIFLKKNISIDTKKFLESIGFFISRIDFLNTKPEDFTGMEIKTNVYNDDPQVNITHSILSAKIIFNLTKSFDSIKNYRIIAKLTDQIDKINKYFYSNEKQINESQKIIKSFNKLKKEIEDSKSLENNVFINQNIKKFEKFPILFKKLNQYFQAFNLNYNQDMFLNSIQEEEKINLIKDEYAKFQKFQKLLNSIKNKKEIQDKSKLQNQIDEFKSFPKFYRKLQEELNLTNDPGLDNHSSKIILNKALELNLENQNINI